LPPWLPTPPRWPHDKAKQAALPQMYMNVVSTSQLRADGCWRLICSLQLAESAAHGETELRTVRAWSAALAVPAGFDVPAVDLEEKMTGTDFLNNVMSQNMCLENGGKVDEAKLARARAVVRKCDFKDCGKVTTGECLCGEAYCSRACQKSNWTDHRPICAQVLDNR
jgi:hypothetical protein